MLAFTEIAKEIEKEGGDFFIVGGWVRDLFMGRQPKDMDFVVTSLSPEKMEQVFSKFGTIVPSHPSAPVWAFKLGDEVFDIALARREISTGPQKEDVVFEWLGVSIEEDLFRRDLTINAMAIRLLDWQLIDPFGGEKDLIAKVLRHIVQETF